MIVLWVSVALALAACGPVGAEATQPPVLVETQEAVTEAPVTEAPATEAPAPHPAWVEYRDARYGYGIAVPCYWPIIPTPLEGFAATMTMHSYTEEYFAANSERGEWLGGIWPDGALKADVIVWENVPAEQTLVEFLTAGFESDTQEITATEEVTFGLHPALVAHTLTTFGEGLVALFRISPDRVLMFVPFPPERFENPDMLLVLASLALTADEAVTLPTVAPGAPLGTVPEGCTAGE